MPLGTGGVRRGGYPQLSAAESGQTGCTAKPVPGVLTSLFSLCFVGYAVSNKTAT